MTEEIFVIVCHIFENFVVKDLDESVVVSVSSDRKE